MRKKNLIVIPLLMVMAGPVMNLFAQDTKATFENIDFYVVEEKIVVSYDLVKASPQETFEVSLEFVNENNEIIIPVTVEGDVGYNIKGGKGKKIYWDVFSDVDEIAGEIKPRLNIISSDRLYGGPANALYSVMVPGLGDYKTAPPSEMIIKPYYRTIVAYGLVGYGIYERINANKKYDDYETSTNRDQFDDLYNQANNANHRSQVAVGLGLAAWTFDVVWVIVKGAKNNKENKFKFQGYTGEGPMPVYDENGIGIRYVIRF